MAPSLFTANMGLAFDAVDPAGRSQTAFVARDRQGLSKAERLLGVSDTARAAASGTPERRPQQRKLRNMGSNLNLLTDLKRAISGNPPRNNSRSGRLTPTPAAYPEPIRRRPSAHAFDADQSDAEEQERSPLSPGTVPAHYTKSSPHIPFAEFQQPLAVELSSEQKPKMGKYTEQEQDKIMQNLMINGMMSLSDQKKRTKRPHTSRSHQDRNSHKHTRGDSAGSKASNTASSKYSQDQDGQRQSSSRKGSGASAGQSQDDTPRRHSERKSAQILTPRVDSQAPGIRISRIESPEGERIRTWLTYTDVSSEASNGKSDWLTPHKLSTVQEGQSSTSVHTMTSLETGTIFPIQGGPDDWSTLHRHSRQSSVLVNATAIGEHHLHAPAAKGGKVYYTDLQVESVLALSSSGSDSETESVDSALARRRHSMMSNGADTQPTAWSSTSSSRSQSRKMSVNTHATSPTNRHSFSSDTMNHPMPNPPSNLSREPSGASQSALDSPRHPRKMTSHAKQPSSVPDRIDEDDLPDYDSAYDEDLTSPTDGHAASSPTLSPTVASGTYLSPMTPTTQEGTTNPLLEAIRDEGLGRTNSGSSTRSFHNSRSALDFSAPASPAPTKPLPPPPIQLPSGPTPPTQTPLIQTPVGDDDNSSIFSFPKPPRLNRTRSRSTEMLNAAGEIADSTSGQTSGQESSGSDGSNDTIKATSMRRKHSNLSIQTANETSSEDSSPGPADNFLSPNAAYNGGPYVIEEFSPIVFAFPEHIHQHMSQFVRSDTPLAHNAGNDYDEPPQANNIGDKAIEAEATAAVSTSFSSEQGLQVVLEDQAEHAEFEAEAEQNQLASKARLSGLHANHYYHAYPIPRTAPLPIKTDLSPVEERPSSAGGIRTAPANVQTHWEKAVAANFPSIPLPQGPTRPLRRFHLPTTSTASTMTSRSAPSPNPAQGTFEVRSARSGSVDGSWNPSMGRSRAGSRAGLRAVEGQSPSGKGMGMRTSKRISTGKGIEPLRLSRIGNAV